MSSCDQVIKIRDREFALKEGDVIKFSCSKKWLVSEADAVFKEGGFKRIALFQDKKEYFGLFLFEKE